MNKLRLPAKLTLLATLTILAVALTFSYAGVSALNQLSVKQNKQMMSAEISAILQRLKAAHDQRGDSRIGDVKSFIQKSQADILAGLKNYHFGNDGRLYIIAEGNNMLLVGKDQSVSDFQPEDLKRLLAQPSGIVEAEIRGHLSFVALDVFEQWGWRLALVVPDVEINAPREKFLEKVPMLLAACLVICIPMFAFVGTSFVRPLRSLSKHLSSITADNLDNHIKIPDPDPEIEELNQSLQTMKNRLQAAISGKKHAE